MWRIDKMDNKADCQGTYSLNLSCDITTNMYIVHWKLGLPREPLRKKNDLMRCFVWKGWLTERYFLGLSLFVVKVISILWTDFRPVTMVLLGILKRSHAALKWKGCSLRKGLFMKITHKRSMREAVEWSLYNSVYFKRNIHTNLLWLILLKVLLHYAAFVRPSPLFTGKEDHLYFTRVFMCYN